MMEVTKVWWDGNKIMAEPVDPTTIYREPAQQEPVAYLVDGDLYYPEEIDWESLQEQGHTVASLYTQAQRKPLTDEEIKGIYEDCDAPTGGQFTLAFARAIEAAHNIKENT